MKKMLAAFLVSAAVVSAPAMAGVKCDVPKDEWQSEQAFRAAIKAKGWEITQFEIDDGCYEIDGYDEQQRRIEACFNPKTFEMVEMELDD
ncbi:PepSY domain-containing protein [Marinobacterium marinum]|uniref:PepSY domain-containing protein n=1 Tax=Marinobacterium marinum TaxID=2756129 RepID=A0A7W2ABT7_9GAMM|nr:PepSY domain-containing protein [Marinobacterium marinum]MBA4501822.1 PepSY domain-containing protein [Marinobacterium marinum]